MKKIFVFTEVFMDWSFGCAIAIAETKEDAMGIIKKRAKKDELDFCSTEFKTSKCLEFPLTHEGVIYLQSGGA